MSTAVGDPSSPLPGDRAAVAVPASAPWLVLGALVVLAALLRFATLTSQSIWFDEAATWDLMRLPFGEMLGAIPERESNPPLFYVLEWLWTHVFGLREAGLRSLPALAGTLTVPVAYALGRRVAGSAPAGLAAAALAAVNPMLIWYSQEARSYALVVLLSAAALLLALRALDDERPRWLAWWAVAAALALCTHYFAIFVLVPQAAWLVWRHPRRGAALGALGGLAVVGLALLPLLLAQRDNPYDIAGFSFAVRLAQVPKQFLLGYRGPLAVPTAIVAGLLVLGGAWLLVRRTRPAARARALLVAGVGALGVLLPLAGIVVGSDYLNARNVLPALVPLVVALGVGFGAVEGRSRRAARAGVAMVGTLCVLSVAIVVTVAVDPSYQRADWRGVAKALGTSDAVRAVVISPANGELALRFYRPGIELLTDRPVQEVDVIGVAGSTDPGAAPELPAQVGSELGIPGFGAPERTETDTYVILRFRADQPIQVAPIPLAAVRFSSEPPSVDVLPAGARPAAD